MTRRSSTRPVPSSFTRMFKNAYGMSPREWRHQANTRRSEPTGEFINQ